MVDILLSKTEDILRINNYNGDSGEAHRYRILSGEIPHNLNFFREGNNISYVGGKIDYGRECNNLVIISPYARNFLKNIRNAFIFVENSSLEISPIHNLIEIIDKSRFYLSEKVINYNIPSSVLRRENLNKKNLEDLERILRKSYGVASKEIIPIQSRSKNDGIFYLIDKNGNKYIFKFRDKTKIRAEILSEISGQISNFFPRNHKRIDSKDYTTDIDDGWYGLESFVEGKTKERNPNYFTLIGRNIAELHKDLSKLLENQPFLNELFGQGHRNLTESNILSLYLDLVSCLPNKFLLSELEKMIYNDFSSKTRELKKAFIHRDLNQSNILWIEETPKIIDLESMGISERINEFIPALLLRGNRGNPDYVPHSMKPLINEYPKLSPEEEIIFPELLKYSLIRYFVIRNIRRNFGDNNELNKLQKDLNQITQEI